MIKKSTTTLLITYALIYSSISHIILPSLEMRSFFIFSDWNFFSDGAKKEVADLTWDNMDTFFLLDHVVGGSNTNEDVRILFYLLQDKKIDKIRKDHLDFLKKFCGCDKIEYVLLKSSYYEHFRRKKGREVIKRIPL